MLVGRRPLVKDVHFWSGIGWVTMLALIVLARRPARPAPNRPRAGRASTRDDSTLAARQARRRRAASTPARRSTRRSPRRSRCSSSSPGCCSGSASATHAFRFASTVVLHDGLMYVSRDPARRPSLPRADLPRNPPRAPRDDARDRRRAVGGATSREMEARMSSMTTVLVVDDEPIVRDVVVRYLAPRRLHDARGRRRRRRAAADRDGRAGARRSRRDAARHRRARALPLDPQPLRPAGDHAYRARRGGRPDRRPRAWRRRLRDEAVLAARARDARAHRASPLAAARPRRPSGSPSPTSSSTARAAR